MSVLKIKDSNGNWIPIHTITGEDGYSPSASVSKELLATTITITDKTGTTTAVVYDGISGEDGQDGEDGFSPEITVNEITGGHEVSIQTKDGYQYFNVYDGAKGDAGNDGYTPVKGTDYWTAADKAAMVSDVIAALNSEQWTFTLADGTTVTKRVVVKV